MQNASINTTINQPSPLFCKPWVICFILQVTICWIIFKQHLVYYQNSKLKNVILVEWFKILDWKLQRLL